MLELSGALITPAITQTARSSGRNPKGPLMLLAGKVSVRPVAAIEPIIELNIGHAIVSRALYVGMREAVAEMRRILDVCR